MRVLLADRDQFFLEIVQSFLWDRGHEAEIACDGIECWALLREFAPDIVVLGDGLLWGGCEGVLAKMRDDPLLSKLPVILTGDRQVREELVALSTLPAACLVKPYRLGELLSHIDAASRHQGHGRPTEEPGELRNASMASRELGN